MHFPAPLRAHVRDAPRLARVVARAFGTSPRSRPGRWADILAVPTAAWHVPLLAVAARQGQVATNSDRTAVIVVGTTSRWLSLATTMLIGVAVWMASSSAAVLALVSVSPTRLVAYIVLDAWCLLQIAVLLPQGLHTVAMALQSTGSGAHRIGRHLAEHRAHGHECYVVGPWAAWPPGPGLDLADTALHSLPAHARLIATGRDDRVCTYLRRKGFTTIEARTMIR